MVAQQLNTATEWVKWKRRVRVALIHQLPLRGTKKVLLRAICDLLGEKEAATTSAAHPDALRGWKSWQNLMRLRLLQASAAKLDLHRNHKHECRL